MNKYNKRACLWVNEYDALKLRKLEKILIYSSAQTIFVVGHVYIKCERTVCDYKFMLAKAHQVYVCAEKKYPCIRRLNIYLMCLFFCSQDFFLLCRSVFKIVPEADGAAA